MLLRIRTCFDAADTRKPLFLYLISPFLFINSCRKHVSFFSTEPSQTRWFAVKSQNLGFERSFMKKKNLAILCWAGFLDDNVRFEITMIIRWDCFPWCSSHNRWNAVNLRSREILFTCISNRTENLKFPRGFKIISYLKSNERIIFLYC